MNRAAGPVRFAVLLAAAATGLIGAHLIDYAILYPEPGHRSAVLHLTGHGYLTTAGTVALLLAVGAVLATAARGAFERRVSRPSWGATALQLGVLQSIGFVAIEVGERVAVGAPLRPLFGAILVVGLLVQVTVAELAAAILVLVERGTSTLAARLRRSWPAPRRAVGAVRPPAHDVAPRMRRWERAPAVRAPPSSSLAA